MGKSRAGLRAQDLRREKKENKNNAGAKKNLAGTGIVPGHQVAPECSYYNDVIYSAQLPPKVRKKFRGMVYDGWAFVHQVNNSERRKCYEVPAQGFRDMELRIRETLLTPGNPQGEAEAYVIGDVGEKEILIQPTYENRKLEGEVLKLTLAEQLRAGLVTNDNCPGKK